MRPPRPAAWVLTDVDGWAAPGAPEKRWPPPEDTQWDGCMIPHDWTPVRRPEDDELVGYLVLGRDGTTPVTLFGHPLSGPTGVDEAEALLLERGLPVLADPWWLDGGDDGGHRVQIMSADPKSVVVARADFGFVSPDSERHRLPVPTDRLRPYR